jgi:putative toxin-antitoxin system antitoxin component (TIGR02293 family)
MLTNKPVAATKSRAKVASAATKSRARVASETAASELAYVAGFKGASASKVAAPQVLYTTREQRLRSERSLFSVLLAQSAPASDMEVVKLVHNRLPLSVIDRLLAEGVTKQEIDLVAPPRTLAHRRANAESLTVEESDRAVRLARVVAQTESVFGNKGKAMAWLRQPMKHFEGNTPIEMLATDVGSRLVEEVLVQIDEGFFA